MPDFRRSTTRGGPSMKAMLTRARTAIGIVATVAIVVIWPQANAWALQIANTFSLRDNVGPNTVGTPVGDRLVFGATDVTPAGDPTAVPAPQGPTTGQLSFLPFVFRVMLDDVSEGFLQNRSNTFSAPYVLPPLSGPGTARIDGILSPGEWDNAGRLDFPVLLPPHDGGGTFTATLYVMNDGRNLYLALRAPLVAVPGVLTLTFDNDNDRVFREGDDALGLIPESGLADWYFTTQPPCQPGFFCLVPDEWGGGMQNGIGVVTTSGD